MNPLSPGSIQADDHLPIRADAPLPPAITFSPERSLRVAALLTLSGGFLDAFTYVGHGKVFANSMTGNVIFLGFYAAAGKWDEVIPHLLPILTFLVGVLIANWMRLPKVLRHLSRPALTCLSLEIIFLIFASFLPASFPDLILVPGIAFVAAMQNSSFTLLETWTYNSVMTTGNLRRFAEALFGGILPIHDPAQLRQARHFGLICLCFFAGAIFGGLTTARWHNYALWIPVIFLAAAFFLCFPRPSPPKS